MRSLLCCLVLALTLGCSAGPDRSADSGDGAAEPRDTASVGVDQETVRTGLAAAFAGDQPGPEAETEGECFAERLLATATVEELRRGGIVEDDGTVVSAFPALERPLAEKVVDAQLGCTDFLEDSSQAQTFITKGRLVRERYVACLRRALPDEAVRAAVLAAVMAEWDDPAIEELSSAQVTCAQSAEG